ncbi:MULTISPECIES: DUF4097 family beta strand repeat-containing protein [unclassified Streptomyces]|uniref:DUF4097 family beta strand repeat-containing protein n=1 Tax=unclassified Streptomyces TaxID=2593676 RepID=UPI0033FE6463
MTVRTRRPRTPRPARVLVATGGVVVVALLAGACGADAGEDTDPEHRTFALSGKTLTVDSDDSALELVPADGDAKGVRVTRWFKGKTVLGGDPTVTWKMDGNRLTLDMNCSGLITDCSARHRVEVPRGVTVTVESQDGQVTAAGFREALKVRTKDGSVSVKDAGGPLDLRSSDGSISVKGAEGPLDLRSSDGSIRADGVRSRKVAVDSKDGSVHLELVTVPDRIDAHSKDGSVDIAVPGRKGGAQVAYDVRTESHDGSVDVSVPRDDHSPHRVNVRSADGSVKVHTAN